MICFVMSRQNEDENAGKKILPKQPGKTFSRLTWLVVTIFL